MRPEKSHLGAALSSLMPPWHAWGPLLGDSCLSIVSFLPRPQGASSPACPRDALPSLALVVSFVRPMTLSSRELISLCNYTFFNMIVSLTSAPQGDLGLCSPLHPWLHSKHLWRKKGREGERVAGDGGGGGSHC